jgi:hypothetical protein
VRRTSEMTHVVKGGMCTKGWCSNRFPEVIAYYKQQQTSERQCRSVEVVGKVPAGWSTLYSNPGRGEKFFLFFKTCKPRWGSPKLPTHWVLGVVSLAKKRPKCGTYHAPHLLPSSTMSGHTFPFPGVQRLLKLKLLKTVNSHARHYHVKLARVNCLLTRHTMCKRLIWNKLQPLRLAQRKTSETKFVVVWTQSRK